MYRILLVEDDHALRDLIARGLRAQDFEVITAVDGRSAIRSVAQKPDAIVLDIGLPDSDGRDVCQALRADGVDVPVIFLSARRDINDRLAGFGSGGDDYLPKPFAFAELVARLRAQMRRHGVSPDAADRLRMDPIAHAVSLGERRRTLSPIEYKLLARLLADPNEIVRRRHLREAGWPGGGIVAENTLDQYLSKIRRKVAELDPALGVRSVRGIGYRIERRE
jgi:DNA-binding response OmpR family regulator